VWPIDDAPTLDALGRGLWGTRLVIADGHHRFAAALEARRRGQTKSVLVALERYST
jgi:uncharacterized protein (DUF1015 family)